MQITPFSTGKEIAPFALAVHELVHKLPTTMRTKNSTGVRIEEGKIIDYEYTGPVLEKVLSEGRIIQEIPERGVYKGIPVIVVPIKENDEVICALGLVDITRGVFSDLMHITRRPAEIKEEPRGEFY
ncbi:MAG: DUF2111 domain-containing protein [Methanobacteriaceae archaeon]|jgi:hypothetical protein